MYTKDNKFFIFFLVCFYLLFNIYNGKYHNILIFIVLFCVLTNFVNDKTNLLLSVYVIIIVYNIVTNFHLLENFQDNLINKNEKHTDTSNKRSIVSQPIIKNLGYKKKKRIAPFDVKNIVNNLSERLVKKYLEKLKREAPTLVSTRKVKIIDIIPIKSDLSLARINNMKFKNEIIKSPIVITNDNFLVDGHHRWFIQKSKLKNTKNNDSNDDEDFITCIIVKKNINSFLRDINEYKNDYNENELYNFKLDYKKINSAKSAIENIKKNTGMLEQYVNDLSKLNIV